MVAFALIGNTETIARIATIFVFVTFIIVNLSAIILRIRMPQSPRPYRIPFNIKKIPVISVAGIITTAVLLWYAVYSFIK